MSDIKVIIYDTAGSVRKEATMPADVPVKGLIKVLITKLPLPNVDDGGNPLGYHMVHKQSGKTLAESDTLESAGVEENDILHLIPVLVAGSSNPPDRRKLFDYQKVLDLCRHSSLIQLESTTGNPPERYIILYKCKGIRGLNGGKPVYSRRHRIEIVLPADYPFGLQPMAHYIEGGSWHPNVYANGDFCVGNWFMGMALDELIVDIGEIIQYKNYNPKSPANSEAAKWAEKHTDLFPVDDRPMIDTVFDRVKVSAEEDKAYDFKIHILK